MEALVWIGTIITVIGLLGLVACIVAATNARSAGLDEDALRTRLGRLVSLNLGSLAVAVIGLMTVILGLFLT